MQIINENVSVSGQVTPEQVLELSALGVEVLVCNRPDFEEANQPTFSDIEQAAKELGIDIINIPFAGGQMTTNHVNSFAEILKSNKRIHAYCRTGNRSSHLWAASSSLL